MNPTLKELLILTPLLLLVSYALMRLAVWLRRFRKKPGKPDCWQRRCGTWCVCMSVVSFITLSVIVQEVELVTVWVLLCYFITFLFFAAFFSVAARHKDDEYVPRDSAPGARSGRFYAAVLAELTVLPAATFVLCRCFGTFVLRALLGWMPGPQSRATCRGCPGAGGRLGVQLRKAGGRELSVHGPFLM